LVIFGLIINLFWPNIELSLKRRFSWASRANVKP
jgi:hypothetical protein